MSPAGRPPAQRAKPIDGQLLRSLIQLPEAIAGATEMMPIARLPRGTSCAAREQPFLQAKRSRS